MASHRCGNLQYRLRRLPSAHGPGFARDLPSPFRTRRGNSGAPYRPERTTLARPIITLTTDYGTSDHFVAVMKGVILSINPDVTLVDITHSVLPHDILDGALAIGQTFNYFPPNFSNLSVLIS